MSTWKRFFFGGLGALMPVLMFFATVDWETTFRQASGLTVLGYCVRAVALFSIGGVVASLHSEERHHFKLFEFGIAAPALISGYMAASSLRPAPTPPIPQPSTTPAVSQPSTAPPVSQPQTTIWQLISHEAIAQPASSQTVKKFTLPPATRGEQFWQGLTGQRPQAKDVWFVIVGSELQLADAFKKAAAFNQKFPKYKAEVYDRYGDNQYYAVVIGANLSQPDAHEFRDRAVKDGFPKDAYFKTFPNLPPAPSN